MGWVQPDFLFGPDAGRGPDFDKPCSATCVSFCIDQINTHQKGRGGKYDSEVIVLAWTNQEFGFDLGERLKKDWSKLMDERHI